MGFSGACSARRTTVQEKRRALPPTSVQVKSAPPQSGHFDRGYQQKAPQAAQRGKTNFRDAAASQNGFSDSLATSGSGKSITAQPPLPRTRVEQLPPVKPP